MKNINYITMKNLLNILIINLLALSSFAQNSITTPTGTPLTIGNNGVKLANLTSASVTTASNSKALSVDASGNLILVPDVVGTFPNPITTSPGTPLTIGNNGVKLANLTSASATSTSNNKALSVDATGNIILVPDNAGTFPNPITTSPGTPLTIGNNGVRLANLTSASATTVTNGKALSVNASGDLILVPDVSGSGGGGNPNFITLNANLTFGGISAGAFLLTNSTAASNATGHTLMGTNAGAAIGTNSTVTTYGNTLIGAAAGNSTTNGGNNSFLGISSGVYNTTGSFNQYFGSGAGANNRTGDHNVMIGANAGYDGVGTTAKNSSYGVFIGNYTGAQNIGNFNIAIGHAASSYNTTGGATIAIGGYANGHSAATNNINSVFIGSQSGTWTGTNHASPTTVVNNLTNATAIGYQAQVTVSNALTLGGTGANAVKVGIGMHNPQYPLDVKGVVNMRTAFNSPSMKINDRDFMGIGESGEFWVSNFKMKYENEAQWSDKVFEKGYKFLSIKELDEFVNKNKHLPNIPSAKEVVKNGVDNTEMTSKLLEKIEEMSLYIIQLEKRLSKVENIK
jgi:trimeric autotransporter adhesin